MTSDRWFLISSEISIFQVLLWKIVVWDHSDNQFWTPYMWSVPLDRCSPAFYVRDKNFSESHKLKRVTNRAVTFQIEALCGQKSCRSHKLKRVTNRAVTRFLLMANFPRWISAWKTTFYCLMRPLRIPLTHAYFTSSGNKQNFKFSAIKFRQRMIPMLHKNRSYSLLFWKRSHSPR